MLNPYAVFAGLAAQAQAVLGGQPADGNRLQGATLTIYGVTIPCTHSPIMRDWIVENGKSPTTIVEQCLFLASDLPGTVPNSNPPKLMSAGLDKAVPCVLQPNPKFAGIPMQLWVGGIISGGLLYRFSLVSASYRS